MYEYSSSSSSGVLTSRDERRRDCTYVHVQGSSELHVNSIPLYVQQVADVCMCVLHIKPFFLPVLHPTSCTFISVRADYFPREIQALWSQDYDADDATAALLIVHCLYLVVAMNAIGHPTGYDRHDVHIL